MELNECVDKKIDQNLEENENRLDERLVASYETLLLSHTPCAFDEENIIIAPDKGQTPFSVLTQFSVLTDTFCEELTFPYLLPRVKFGCCV